MRFHKYQVRGGRLPPSPRLRRTAVAIAEAGQADLLTVRLKPDTTYECSVL